MTGATEILDGDPLQVGLVGLTRAAAEAILRGEPVGGVAALEPSSETFDCVHRGPLLRIGTCDQCGRKGQPFEVLVCALHGECSVIRKHTKIRSCAACVDRTVETQWHDGAE